MAFKGSRSLLGLFSKAEVEFVFVGGCCCFISNAALVGVSGRPSELNGKFAPEAGPEAPPARLKMFMLDPSCIRAAIVAPEGLASGCRIVWWIFVTLFTLVRRKIRTM